VKSGFEKAPTRGPEGEIGDVDSARGPRLVVGEPGEEKPQLGHGPHGRGIEATRTLEDDALHEAPVVEFVGGAY
jgi:hypothetical protein